MNSLTSKIKNLKSWLIDVRRDLLKTPELGLEEFLTKEKIIKYLEEIGIDYKSDSIDLKSSQVVLEIPKNLHENINYTLAPINSSEDGKKKNEFIKSKYSKKILREYGFLINE